MTGDEEDLRARLAQAIERFGYQVISDLPLIARRRAHFWGKLGLSYELFDYSAKLTVTLRQQRPRLFKVTFDYEIDHPFLSSKDGKLLELEAEAIAASAAQRNFALVCYACGASAAEDSRFCRRCGAPMNTLMEPSETELMKLGSGLRSAYQQTWASLILVLFAAIVIAIASKPSTFLPLFFVLLGAAQLSWTLRKMRATFKKLERKQPKTLIVGPSPTAQLPPPSHAIKSHAAPPSIAEGTTELLENDQQSSKQEEGRILDSRGPRWWRWRSRTQPFGQIRDPCEFARRRTNTLAPLR
ncbi:MAG: hypothetical protein C4334_04995 [Pyrinomonas sp.]|uniref:zinc ribbon domain-containing protein n=1 Tax=Pyrinomonas sp. TaxID=2080306 RepID=UPI00332B8020